MDDNEEGVAAAPPVPVVLTAEEERFLPAVRYLVSKAVGKGVVLHSCLDYVVGTVAPVAVQGNNYEEEYSGEVQDYVVTVLAPETTADGDENAEGEAKAATDGEVVEEEEEEEEEEGEKLPANDPRVVREAYGMPPSLSHVLDIGPMTQETWAKELNRARSVLWLQPVGAVAHQDFAAGSQALLDALVPEDDEAIEDTEAASTTTAAKRLVVLVGPSLVGALRAGGMSDEDVTLVSSGDARTVVELLAGKTHGISKLTEVTLLLNVVEEANTEAEASEGGVVVEE
jgi:hypothetical protein